MLNGTDLSLYSFRDVVSRWATMCFIVRSSEAQKQSKKPNTANICLLGCSFDFGVNNSRTEKKLWKKKKKKKNLGTFQGEHSKTVKDSGVFLKTSYLNTEWELTFDLHVPNDKKYSRAPNWCCRCSLTAWCVNMQLSAPTLANNFTPTRVFSLDVTD